MDVAAPNPFPLADPKPWEDAPFDRKPGDAPFDPKPPLDPKAPWDPPLDPKLPALDPRELCPWEPKPFWPRPLLLSGGR